MSYFFQINVISAIIMIGVLVLVFRTYQPLIRSADSRWMSLVFLALCIICGAIILRATYWDIVQGLLGPERWLRFRTAMGGQKFSTVFSSLVTVGGIVALHARVLMIPREQRDGWRWWNVWRIELKPCVIKWRFWQ